MSKPNKPNEGVLVRMPPDLLEALDEYRREQPDLPSRPEALRRIAAKWLGVRADG